MGRSRRRRGRQVPVHDDSDGRDAGSATRRCAAASARRRTLSRQPDGAEALALSTGLHHPEKTTSKINGLKIGVALDLSH